MNNDLNRKLNSYEYFIVTSNAIVGILNETKEDVEGIIICAKTGLSHKLGSSVILNKSKVVSSLHADNVQVIEEIPSWYLEAMKE